MNEAEFLIRTPQDEAMTLDSAVLIYKGQKGGAMATVHEIENVDGEAVIGAGRAMTSRSARLLSKALLKNASIGGYVPETVRYMDGDVLVWWLSPGPRHIAFKVSKENAELFGGTERGETVPHPGLVFAASPRLWRVWAVKGQQRPNPDTPLYRAPYFNVDAGGTICRGNVAIPQSTTMERIKAWNEAFTCSFFTHPNGGDPMVKYPGGPYLGIPIDRDR